MQSERGNVSYHSRPATSLVRQVELARACEETLHFIIKLSHLDR